MAKSETITTKQARQVIDITRYVAPWLTEPEARELMELLEKAADRINEETGLFPKEKQPPESSC